MTTLNMRTVLLTAVAATLFSLQSAVALPLVSDDFNDNSLDPAKWTPNTSFGGSSVTEQNQRLELVNRGHLNTTQEFDPVALGGLRITGDWTFVSGQGGPGAPEFIQILTRSDGVPDGQFGETANGVEFFMQTSNGDLLVRSRNNATINVTQDTSASLGAVAQNQVFDFDIVDDGVGGLSFTLTEVGGAGRTATATGTVTSDVFDSNFVVFHNRENEGRTSYLDNVSIDTLQVIPEPSSIVLAVMGLAGLGLMRRRRHRAAQF